MAWNPDKDDTLGLLSMLAVVIIVGGSIGSVLLLGPALLIGMSMMLLERGDPAGIPGVILLIILIVLGIVKYQNHQIRVRHKRAIEQRSEAE